jgi:hypothetical protein
MPLPTYLVPYRLEQKRRNNENNSSVMIAALFATGLSDLAISYAAEPEVATVKDFKWGDQTNLKEHLLKHVTFPATGKVIKESCKKEFPDEFSKEQGAYLDAALKDDTTYNNSAEVMSALNLK